MTEKSVLQEIRNENTLVRVLLILLIIAVGTYVFTIVWQVLGNYADIFIVLICAWLLSFVLEPLVEKISKITKLSKVWATAITYLLIASIFTAAILLFIPTVAVQIQTLIKIIPLYIHNAPPFMIRSIDSFTGSLSNTITYVPSVAQFFFLLFVILIISFYFIVDKQRINKEIYDLTPDKWRDELLFLQRVVGNVFAKFIRVQLIFGLLAGITTWVFLTIMGVEFAASTSLLSGIFAIVPLVGPIFSLIPPVFVAFIQDPTKALIVGILVLVAQQFIFNILGPKLFGNAFRVHPVIVLISFIVGYKVAGTIGIFLAVPVLGIIAVIVRDLGHHFITKDKK